VEVEVVVVVGLGRVLATIALLIEGRYITEMKLRGNCRRLRK